ncbi:MAG TPA: alpha/beta fold hydrolase [Bryobacteraceae bacterium]|nr:alpha/beta fold hydrolase [Bryobacteraceae bacterium]
MTSRTSLTHAVREPLDKEREAPPMLVLLHGVGSNEQDLLSLAPMLDGRFFVVSVRAPITLQHGSYAWYHIQRTPDGAFDFDPAEAESSRQRLLDFVDELNGSYDVDADRVYLMGFSQGCIMSLACALTQPRKFAGVVGMSGRWLPGMEERVAPADKLRGLPVTILHGTQDGVITIDYGRALRSQLESLPVDLTYREYPMGHSISQESFGDVQTWLSRELGRNTDWREQQG